MTMCLQECHLVFLPTKWPFCSSDLLSLALLCFTLMSWWHPGKPACSKAPRVLTHYLRFLGRISHLGKCKWSHLQDCAERHVNLGTWICQRRQLKRCRLPSVPPAPRVSRSRPHSRRPCVCSLPLLSPLLTFVVKIWKGCTGIQTVHLPFLRKGAKIQANYYVHNHSKL